MDKLEKKMQEYEELFGDSFPSFNFMHLDPEGIIKIIDDCLEEGKDVYELGYIDDDDDVKY